MKRTPAIRFVMFAVLLDVIGIGLIIPVMPGIVGQFTTDPASNAYWYGALMMTYGAAQFLNAPLLGALSDRYGRRPVLLLGICGLGATFAITALAQSDSRVLPPP
jgi:MFS transporter, DHA1 family, tetracycline resistance protein